MRYFPPELLIDASSPEDPEWFRTASPLFERNLKLYNKQLGDLEGRVSSTAWRFMTRVNTHDGTLLSIEAGDFVFGVARTERSHLVNRRLAKVVLRFAEPKARAVYQLTYAGIKAFSLEYRKILDWDCALRKCFDDWLIDEWTSADWKHLSHEVLFSSGAWFRIVFRKLSVKRCAKTGVASNRRSDRKKLGRHFDVIDGRRRLWNRFTDLAHHVEMGDESVVKALTNFSFRAPTAAHPNTSGE